MSQTTTIDAYQAVTDRIIELLEAGTVPWQKPWVEAGLPCNAESRKPYNGINVFLLACLGYEKNLFLTWQQIQQSGGKVKRGEKGHIIVFYKKIQKKDEGKENEDANETKKSKTKGFLRYYKVFNVAQCDNLPEKFTIEAMAEPFSPIEQCESVINAMPQCPKITVKGEKAFYDPLADSIQMPTKKLFPKPESYYATLYHELVHSTGHQSRLNRKEVAEKIDFGSESYSLEELVGEIGAAYLQSFTGIVNDSHKNSAAYISSWLEVLKKDKHFIFTASRRAQHAVDFILNRIEAKEAA
ncbi:ArdC family protein [Parasediminibacterium sp. JCM 36343]|uniref:ArdC family protein n=1 Tax=Parasediminibacterium sp. JCM 36343 TaxID=3374279 RepID=UPI00397C6793